MLDDYNFSFLKALLISGKTKEAIVHEQCLLMKAEERSFVGRGVLSLEYDNNNNMGKAKLSVFLNNLASSFYYSHVQPHLCILIFSEVSIGKQKKNKTIV